MEYPKHTVETRQLMRMVHDFNAQITRVEKFRSSGWRERQQVLRNRVKEIRKEVEEKLELKKQMMLGRRK